MGSPSSPPPLDIAAIPSPSEVSLTTAPVSCHARPRSLPSVHQAGPSGHVDIPFASRSWPALFPPPGILFPVLIPHLGLRGPDFSLEFGPFSPPHLCPERPPRPQPIEEPGGRGLDSKSQKALRCPWVGPGLPLRVLSLGGAGNFQILALSRRGGDCWSRPLTPNPTPPRRALGLATRRRWPVHSTGSPGATHGWGW